MLNSVLFSMRMMDVDSSQIELFIASVTESLKNRDFNEFIHDSCVTGCYACGKKLKELGAPYSVVKHYRDMSRKQKETNDWDMFCVHEGVLRFLEQKLAQIFPNGPDPDSGKHISRFVSMCGIGTVQSLANDILFEANDKYVIPATGILVNLPAKCHHGEIVSRFEDCEIKKFLFSKGYEPVSVKTVWDYEGFCKCALVDFGSSLSGLVNAKAFEQGFGQKGFGKADYEAYVSQIKPSVNVYGWVAMESDVYFEKDFARVAISEKLRKKMSKGKIRVPRYVDFLRELNDARKAVRGSSWV